MALNVGRTGSVKFGNNTLINISNWTMDDETPILKVAVFDQDSMKIAGVGIRNVTGTISGYWDTAASSYQTNTESHYLSGGSATLDLYFNGSEYFSGTAYISKISINADASDSVVPVTMNYEIDGSVTRN